MNQIEVGQAPDNGFNVGDYILIGEELYIIASSPEVSAVSLADGLTYANELYGDVSNMITCIRSNGDTVSRVDRQITITPASGTRQ